MANLKKKLSLLAGLCVMALFCFLTATAVGAAAAPATYPCFVSVEGVGTVNGGTRLETEAFSEVVLSAPSEKDGQSFLYWKNATTGLIVSGNRRTVVRVYDNTVFEAVYGDVTEAVADAFVLVTDGELSLYAYRYVPEGYKVVSYGVLYSTLKNPVDLSDKTLDDVDAPSVKVAEKSTSTARVGSVYYTVTAKSFSYRPFVTVEDASGNVETVYGDAAKYVPCEEHTYLAYKDTATCGVGGTAYLRCDACAYHVAVASQPTGEHDFTIEVPEKAATCLEDGYSQHMLCSDCGAANGKVTAEENEEYKAKGHDFKEVPAVAPTCYSYGYDAYKECSLCHETEGYNRIDMIDHTLSEEYFVPASYRDGAYMAKHCSVEGCYYSEKTYVEGDKLNYVVTEIVASAEKQFTFTANVSDTGVYEVSFKIETLPGASGYTSVYAVSGKGSTNRIGGAEVDADGYSLYKFYVYLNKGENTVAVDCQGTMAIAEARLCFVDAAYDAYSFEYIDALTANAVYGDVLTSATSGSRNVRNGVLQLRSGDTVTLPFTVERDSAYRLMLLTNGCLALTVTDKNGNAVASFAKTDFVKANEDVLVAGSESAVLYRLAKDLVLAAGEYTLTLSVVDNNLILGAVMLSPEVHTHEFTNEVAGKASTCHEGGYDAYKICTLCGIPEAVLVMKEPDETLHDFSVSVQEKLPACIEAGYTAHKICSVCGAKNEDYRELEPIADAHDFSVNVEQKPATCKEAGYKAYVKCSLCGEPETEIEVLPVDPEAHAWKNVDEKLGNCQRPGWKAYKECTLCGAKDGYVALPVDPENHSWIDVEEKLPTCLEDGYSAHRYCQRAGCGLTEGKETEGYEKLGHALEKVEAKAPSCVVTGCNEHQSCSRCGFSPDRFIIPETGHEYGERYTVAATYKSGAYTAVKCGLCGDVKKEYQADSEKILFVGSNIAHNGTTVTFDLTVPAAGVYELSFKLASTPSATGYTSVYAQNGKGSVNRIGTETDENGDSAYKFYVYLEKGNNVVTMNAQAALTVSRVTATYMGATASSIVETLESVTKLKPNETYAIPNGSVVTSADTGNRAVRNGVLQLRGGDTVSFTLNASVDGTYGLAVIFSGAEFSLTITKGEDVITLGASDFSLANAAALVKGSESARLYLANKALSLEAGEYTLTFASTRNFILGATYMTLETHVCDFSAEIPAIDATCLSAGHEKYTACSICGEPEDAVVGIPKDETAHNFSIEVEEVPATCQTSGVSAYKICSVCGAENGEKTELPVDPEAHSWNDVAEKAATCIEAGYSAHEVCSVCSAKNDQYEEYPIDPEAHSWNDVAEKLPTCTEDGHSAYKECALCATTEGKETAGYESEGHTWNDVPAKPASCGEAGYSAHKTCSVCGEKDDQYEEYPSLEHTYGDAVHVDATYTEGGYEKKECENCGNVEKTYIETEPKLFYTLSVDKSDKRFSFGVTVEDAGLYEIAFKFTSAPAASSYTSVYAVNGKGSTLRIGSETDADGYSRYCFYVYLEKGANTVSVDGQATMSVASARITYVTGVTDAMTETFESISKLEASKTYTIPNGNIVVSSTSGGRNIRHGVLQLRSGDKVSFTLTVGANVNLDLAVVMSNADYSLTITKGDSVITLGASDFVAANVNALKTQGSESTTLWTLADGLALEAGEYTVTFVSTGNFILGAVYFSVGEHTCDYVTVEGALPTLTAPGYTSYEGCIFCGTAKTEKQEIAPLYHKSDVVTVDSDAITVNGQTATVTVTVEKDGFYYLTSDMTLASKAYYSATSDKLNYSSMNRAPAGVASADYGVTVYLTAGENTVTISAKASISSMTAATFTRVSEKMSASLVDSYRSANGSEVVMDHEEKKLVVSEDGTFCLGGLVKLNGTGLEMKVEIYDEAGTTLVETVTVDTATLTALMAADGRLSDGSSNTSYYLALDTITLTAGTYSVKTTMKAPSGGNYVNYYGIVLTELA